jgi:hypothetical protein
MPAQSPVGIISPMHPQFWHLWWQHNPSQPASSMHLQCTLLASTGEGTIQSTHIPRISNNIVNAVVGIRLASAGGGINPTARIANINLLTPLTPVNHDRSLATPMHYQTQIGCCLANPARLLLVGTSILMHHQTLSVGASHTPLRSFPRAKSAPISCTINPCWHPRMRG